MARESIRDKLSNKEPEIKKVPEVKVEPETNKQEIFTQDSSAITAEIERKRRKREEAKQSIIRKINADANSLKGAQAQVSHPRTIPQKPKVDAVKPSDTAQIKKTSMTRDVIKREKTESIPVTTPKPTRKRVPAPNERLSYTLQMDTVSDDQVAAYKKRKERQQGINIDDKFVQLNPKITRYYITTISILIILVGVALYFMNMNLLNSSLN